MKSPFQSTTPEQLARVQITLYNTNESTEVKPLQQCSVVCVLHIFNAYYLLRYLSLSLAVLVYTLDVTGAMNRFYFNFEARSYMYMYIKKYYQATLAPIA